MPGNILGKARKIALSPVKRLLNLVDPPVITLIYHRVSTLSSDPEMLAVTPENFRAQMQHLKETVALVRFEEDWAKGPREPAVCVTFDDGYADNVLEALPILEEIGVPATFFVSTGIINSASCFWWHELERIILEGGELPPSFTLRFERFGKSWPTIGEPSRRALYQDLVHLMNNTDDDSRNRLLQQLRSWANYEGKPAGIHRLMTVEELRSLSASRWSTIGAHTVTHSRLSALHPNGQREEIETSNKQLESWLGRKIEVFSYPFGKRRDYNKKSIGYCKNAGFIKAAANFPGQAHHWTDPFQIPRHLVRNWQVEIFAEKLRGFWTR